MATKRSFGRWTPCAVLGVLALGSAAWAADQPQWGRAWSRNMVSDETGLPETFDPATGRNIKWSVRLGTNTHATPVVAGGKVLVGTNNDVPRDPRHEGDRGVLMCLDEADGRFCWQLVVPKIHGDRYKDWPLMGLCSPATVEGKRVYVVSNRGEVLCLDLAGQADGNDGPFKDEGRFMADGGPPMEVGPTDADILWRFDPHAEAGSYPHDSAHASILIDGRFLYLNTSTGVDNTHRQIRRPNAPSLIVLDKATGRFVAQDGERIGWRIFHCTWSSPALGEVGGRRLVFFGGGDGLCYAFEALRSASATDPVAKLKKIWWFDCDPTAPKQNVHQYMRNRNEGPSNIKGMPVFYRGRVYVAVGGDVWWGKNQAWLKCIDAAGAGDITAGGQRWSYPLLRHCCSTPSISGGLVYVADCGRTVHCVDAETGKPYWTHETKGEMWGSTLVADGKVYVGTRRKDFWILAAGKEKRVLCSVEMDGAMSSTPVAAGGVLYISTANRLYAVQKGAK